MITDARFLINMAIALALALSIEAAIVVRLVVSSGGW
jgi:hypothetical protein